MFLYIVLDTNKPLEACLFYLQEGGTFITSDHGGRLFPLPIAMLVCSNAVDTKKQNHVNQMVNIFGGFVKDEIHFVGTGPEQPCNIKICISLSVNSGKRRKS